VRGFPDGRSDRSERQMIVHLIVVDPHGL
jgi:hypothetical protein